MTTALTYQRSGQSRTATHAAGRPSLAGYLPAAAFAAALLVAAAVLTLKGTDSHAIVIALRVTARWSFLLFWIAYAGRALTTMFGPRLAPLARGRDFGLAYGAAQLIHISLVIWLFRISPTPPLSGRLFWFFVIAIIWTYLLMLFSFRRLVEFLGPRGRRLLRLVGMNYILLAFARDFVPPMLHPTQVPYSWSLMVKYLPFAAMCIVAPLLVLAANGRHRAPKLIPASAPGAC